MKTQADAYRAGWRACMAGVDGRYAGAAVAKPLRYAWDHGFLDAMEAEDGEEPQPATAGYEDELTSQEGTTR